MARNWRQTLYTSNCSPCFFRRRQKGDIVLLSEVLTRILRFPLVGRTSEWKGSNPSYPGMHFVHKQLDKSRANEIIHHQSGEYTEPSDCCLGFVCTPSPCKWTPRHSRETCLLSPFLLCAGWFRMSSAFCRLRYLRSCAHCQQQFPIHMLLDQV